MKKEKPNPTYLAFLVRLWREGDDTWRGTLEDPHSGQRHAFAEVDELLAYIREQTQSDN